MEIVFILCILCVNAGQSMAECAILLRLWWGSLKKGNLNINNILTEIEL